MDRLVTTHRRSCVKSRQVEDELRHAELHHHHVIVRPGTSAFIIHSFHQFALHSRSYSTPQRDRYHSYCIAYSSQLHTQAFAAALPYHTLLRISICS